MPPLHGSPRRAALLLLGAGLSATACAIDVTSSGSAGSTSASTGAGGPAGGTGGTPNGSTTTSATGTGGTGGSPCGAGLGLCGGACVDLGEDPANCGFCGHACAEGGACVAGVCALISCTSLALSTPPLAGLPGLGASGLAAGDFDGDGHVDLAVANGGGAPTNGLTVLLNQGQGTFAAPAVYLAGQNVDAVAVGDLDGDGRPDLAVTNLTTLSVSVLLGQPDGTFGPAVDSFTLEAGHSVVIRDLDGDGQPDLVVATPADNTVRVLLNLGGGVFASAVAYPMGTGSMSGFEGSQELSVVDLTGDGKPDLAVVDVFGNDVVVLRNQGNGTFAPGVAYPTGSLPRAIAAGDLDGDGDVDLVIANQGSDPFPANGSVVVLLNHGDGTFAAPVTYLPGNQILAVAVGDYDGDGKLDIVAAGLAVDVLLNQGAGLFAAPIRYESAAGIDALVSADLDGDGQLNLAATSQYSLDAGDVAVLFDRGAGQLTAVTALSQLPAAETLAVGDLTGDGLPDVLTSRNGFLEVFASQGNRLFAAPVSYGGVGFPAALTTVDLDGDGKRDVVSVDTLGTGVYVLGNQGGGALAAPVAYGIGSNPVTDAETAVAVGDWNGDGKPDLAVAFYTVESGKGYVSVLLNQGDGTLGAPFVYDAGKTPWSIAAVDVDGDGKLDIVTADGSDVAVLHNNGTGTFAAPVTHGAGAGPMTVVAGNLDGDGRANLVVAGTNMLTVLLNQGGSTFTLQSYPVVVPLGLTLGDLNGDGALDISFASLETGDVGVLLGSGHGTFAAPVEFGAGNPSFVAAADMDGDGRVDLAIGSVYLSEVSVLYNVCSP